MNKSKMFFTALAMVVLTGCSTTNHLRHEVVDQLWCSPQVVEYFPAGGVDLENVVAQYYMASASQGRLALVSTNTTALCLRGNFVSFDRSIYDSVTDIEWDTMKDENRLSGTIDDDSQSVEMNEVYVQRVLESLSHFPRLKYLTLNFSGDDEMAMLTVSLAKLSKLKELEYLKLEGVDELFVGFPELAGKMKLKSLVFDGHIDWRMLGGDDHLKTLDLTTMASTFVFWDDSPLERLDMRGVLLLEQGSLKCLKNVKDLVPPIYYSLCNVPKSVEKLNMACSEAPLDGFGALSRLEHLKSVKIQREDEKEVRRILDGRSVEIVVVTDDDLCRDRTKL